MNFHGTLGELQDLIRSAGIVATWENHGPYEVAVVEDGVSNLRLNWWPATGVIQLVGDPAQRVPLLERLNQILA